MLCLFIKLGVQRSYSLWFETVNKICVPFILLYLFQPPLPFALLSSEEEDGSPQNNDLKRCRLVVVDCMHKIVTFVKSHARKSSFGK